MSDYDDFMAQHPTDGTPLGNLRHVVSVNADRAAAEMAVETAANVGTGKQDGLTHGDLRELLRRLGG